MPGRGPQTFKKRQKEQQRRERQQEKMAKRLQRKETHKPRRQDDIGPYEGMDFINSDLNSERERS